MPELMINAGWSEEETVIHYKPRFLHALNVLSECKLDKPVTILDVVDMMDKPAVFNPTRYETVRDTKATVILDKIMSELIIEHCLAKNADLLFATTFGLNKRKAKDLYWKRTSKEIYNCDEDSSRLQPFGIS